MNLLRAVHNTPKWVTTLAVLLLALAFYLQMRHSNDIQAILWSRCTARFAAVRTHGDSLLVDTYLPGPALRPSATCARLKLIFR